MDPPGGGVDLGRAIVLAQMAHTVPEESETPLSKEGRRPFRATYSVVQYVPDIARGEFVNVGVIAGSDVTSEWVLIRISDTARAEAFGDRAGVEMSMDHMARIEERIAHTEDGDTSAPSEAWLEQLYVDHRHTVQFKRPCPMMVTTVKEGARLIADIFLLE